MESNELKKNAASDETELLKNGEVTAEEVTPKGTDSDNAVTAEKSLDSSPDIESDSLKDPVTIEESAIEIVSLGTDSEEVNVPEIVEKLKAKV